MSYSEEWARRQIIKEDIADEIRSKNFRRERANNSVFAKKHPFLARMRWSKRYVDGLK